MFPRILSGYMAKIQADEQTIRRYLAVSLSNETCYGVVLRARKGDQCILFLLHLESTPKADLLLSKLFAKLEDEQIGHAEGICFYNGSQSLTTITDNIQQEFQRAGIPVRMVETHKTLFEQYARILAAWTGAIAMVFDDLFDKSKVSGVIPVFFPAPVTLDFQERLGAAA